MLAFGFDGATLSADLVLSGDGLVQEDGLAAVVITSLFTDRRARPDDPLPAGAGTDRRGWWGDCLATVDGDRFGSRLWLLSREKQTEETRRRAVDYAEEALAWLVEDRLATAVAVTADWLRNGVLALAVTIALPQGGQVRQTVTVPVRSV